MYTVNETKKAKGIAAILLVFIHMFNDVNKINSMGELRC